MRTDQESGQTIISGMGELHLEIIVDRMKREFGVEANVGAPQVAYRETIRRVCEKVEGKFIKQTGGRGQYGHVWLRLDPQSPGKGNEFVDAVKGGSVPREYIPAVKKGVLETLPDGVSRVFPGGREVSRCSTARTTSGLERERVQDGGSMARRRAAPAGPCLLEPIMAVEVETPDDFMGNVVGDLSSRRARSRAGRVPGGGKRSGRKCHLRDVSVLHDVAIVRRRDARPTAWSSSIIGSAEADREAIHSTS